MESIPERTRTDVEIYYLLKRKALKGLLMSADKGVLTK